MAASTITEESAREIALGWFDALDRHAPVDELLTYLTPEGLVMKFPEGTFNGIPGFRDWYDAVSVKFFDEAHTLTSVRILSGSQQSAEIEVVVNWQTKTWTPPQARSVWLGFDASQTWTLAVQDGAVRITEYVVDDITPMPGSPAL
ncbi:nuclear transport factor 2 family protein [Streptomyces sp. NBC_01136]|uniref:nuclear transport factor 2 family protein n=1 Tax=unclassified Streptomyces TaxID=2593676 RepID=UPI003255DC31|nr:nuclear transport factor 2 family protein [Streptomyces sp. NBC_01136]